jgi:hypothetical protein
MPAGTRTRGRKLRGWKRQDNTRIRQRASGLRHNMGIIVENGIAPPEYSASLPR